MSHFPTGSGSRMKQSNQGGCFTIPHSSWVGFRETTNLVALFHPEEMVSKSASRGQFLRLSVGLADVGYQIPETSSPKPQVIASIILA